MSSMLGPAPRSHTGPKVVDSEGDLAVSGAGVGAGAGAVNPGVGMGPTTSTPFQHRFSPYEFNGGTALGVAGPDWVVVASDTRLSSGYSILSRNVSKGKQVTPHCVICTGGCYTDVATLHKLMGIRAEMYEHKHESKMTSTAVAQLLSTTLYGRRFFPFYAFNVVGGLDKDGRGAVFTYDAIGSYERVKYAAQGSGQKLIIPLLDNIVGHKNRTDDVPELTLEETIELMKDAFVTAGEREITVGDTLELFIITKDGTRVERFDLKKD
mmetsp:Transcript_19233/g.40203  ORF Transcript_19233/g.40203 Transcript_19233/m.40203 type:complete len:267 (-) Transcript_19233:56-856(-)